MPKNVIVAAVQLSYTRILFVEIMEYRIKKEEKFPSIINYNFQNHTRRSTNVLYRKIRGKVLGINTGANQWPASGERGEHTRTCMRSRWRIHSSRPHSRCMLPVEKPGLWETVKQIPNKRGVSRAEWPRCRVCQAKFSARPNLVNSLITEEHGVTRMHMAKSRCWCMHPPKILMHRVPYPAKYLSIAGGRPMTSSPIKSSRQFRGNVRIFA